MPAATDTPLTDRQIARRRAVVRTAMVLASEGGYEAVQMREVARSSEIALGTLYNYFCSKDHLLAAGMVEWTERFRDAVDLQPPDAATAHDRVVDLMERATGAMAAAPDITKAMVTALNSPGEQVAGCKEALSVIMNEVLLEALTPEFDPDQAIRMAGCIEHVWYSTLLAWVNGWMDVTQVQTDLLDAVHFVVRT